MARTELQNEPGWVGMFTREQAPGALPNGTVIEKATWEAGDAHPIGTRGVVLGSFFPPEHNTLFYFVEWRPKPHMAVGVTAKKIRRARSD